MTRSASSCSRKNEIGMRLQRQARRAIVGKDLLDQRHRRQLGRWLVVLQAGQERHVALPFFLAERLPQGGPAVDRQRAEHIGLGQPGHHRLAEPRAADEVVERGERAVRQS